jgi:hypothetical protein
LFWRGADETGMPAAPLGVNTGPGPHGTHLGKEHFGGGSFHLLLRISNGGDAFLHTEWASRRRKMPELLSARGVLGQAAADQWPMSPTGH